jgi:hypothetical protein
MKQLLLSFALVLTIAATAQADRGRPVVNPAAPERATLARELPVRGQLVCVFPGADGGCTGAVTFTYEEPRRDYAPATKPAPSRRVSRRPARAQNPPRE